MNEAIAGLNHVNIRGPEDLIERLRVFYRDVIGLGDGPRPPFRSRGYWLYGGGRDLLHLTIAADTSTESSQPLNTGWFNHIAFTIVDLDATIARLDASSIAYERDEVPMLGQVQLFLTDPAGIGVELNFTW